MIKLFPRLGALLLCSVACLAADKPALTEAQLRSMFEVPAGVRLLYKDEDGSTIPFETLARRMMEHKPAMMIKDLAKHEYTLTLQKSSLPPPPKIARLLDFDLKDLGGRQVRSSDLLKKPALISFFFDECVPCIKEVPILNAFARKHPEYNYLAITFDSKEAAAQFVKQRHLEWPVAPDAKEYIDVLGIVAYPSYLLASPTGKVLGLGAGLSSDSLKNPAAGLRELEKWVAAAEQGGGAPAGNENADAQVAGWHVLLDPKLSQFDVYLSYRGDQITSVLKGTAPKDLEPVGFNPPRQNVFSVVTLDNQKVLRVSGEIYGCLVTKQSFSNYHFRAKTQWGARKWLPRLDQFKDSGILYHSRGDFGVDYWKSWALSQEFQVIEHGIGEYWRQATSAFDIRVGPKEHSPDGSPDAPKWNPKAPWLEFSGANNHALAGTDEAKPGGWNTIELVCFADDCVHIVNGKVVMALTHSRYQDGGKVVPLTSGKLQIQSEAAEVFYKDLEIRPIGAMPAEYSQYFK